MIARAFPYDRPCRFQKFEATETILATGTTIWRPGLRQSENRVLLYQIRIFELLVMVIGLSGEQFVEVIT